LPGCSTESKEYQQHHIGDELHLNLTASIFLHSNPTWFGQTNYDSKYGLALTSYTISSTKLSSSIKS
jgi:hypothetical protein